MARDVGLNGVERSGRTREAAMVSDRYEGSELAQVHRRQYRGQLWIAGKPGGEGGQPNRRG